MKNKTVQLDHKKIGRTTLFTIVFPSLLMLLLLPLVIGYLLQLFEYDNKSVNSEYINFYRSFTEFNGMLFTFIAVHIIVLTLGILKYSSKTSKLILEKNKSFFSTGFKTVLILWAWLYISSVLTAGIFGFFDPHVGGFIKTIVLWLYFLTIPYLVFAITHGLLIGYFIGRRIKMLGEKGFA